MRHLQIVATSVEDCTVAEECGADSIELCSAIELGGLTPSIGLVLQAIRSCAVEIRAMLRPRPGGATYADAEFEVMLEDAKRLADAGCDSFVFGAILDGAIDAQHCRQMRKALEECHLTFHRAFDLALDQEDALSLLRNEGINAVLTSGRSATAMEGAAQIAALQAAAGEDITIIPGGGISAANAAALLAVTGCRAVHGSFSRLDVDPALHDHSGYHFGAGPERIRRLDATQVKAVRAAIDSADDRL